MWLLLARYSSCGQQIEVHVIYFAVHTVCCSVWVYDCIWLRLTTTEWWCQCVCVLHNAKLICYQFCDGAGLVSTPEPEQVWQLWGLTQGALPVPAVWSPDVCRGPKVPPPHWRRAMQNPCCHLWSVPAQSTIIAFTFRGLLGEVYGAAGQCRLRRWISWGWQS